jgi:hypothetical protein
MYPAPLLDTDSDIDAVPFCEEMVVEDAVVGG